MQDSEVTAYSGWNGDLNENYGSCVSYVNYAHDLLVLRLLTVLRPESDQAHYLAVRLYLIH